MNENRVLVKGTRVCYFDCSCWATLRFPFYMTNREMFICALFESWNHPTDVEMFPLQIEWFAY